jgi:hypothetical protein
MKKIIFPIFLFFAFLFYATGDEKKSSTALSGNPGSISSIIDNSLYTLLKEKGEVSRTVKKNGTLTLIPSNAFKEKITGELTSINPTISVEILILAHTNSDAGSGKYDALRVYNVLRSISSLKGIEYYSASRKRMRIFYEDAYVVNNPTDKLKIPDPKVAEIPDQSSLFGFLKDSSFGEYVCSIDYLRSGDTIALRMENLTQMWYFVLPAIDPHGMLSYILIIPGDSEILFYGVSSINSDKNMFIAEQKSDSLYNRLKALYNWLEKSIVK